MKYFALQLEKQYLHKATRNTTFCAYLVKFMKICTTTVLSCGINILKLKMIIYINLLRKNISHQYENRFLIRMRRHSSFHRNIACYDNEVRLNRRRFFNPWENNVVRGCVQMHDCI